MAPSFSGFGELSGGGGWSNRFIDAEYERVLLTDAKFHMLAGVGLGLGAGSFTDPTEDLLQLNYALLRTQLTGIYRDKNKAYELGLFAQYHLPLEHRYTPVSYTHLTLPTNREV